jgi:hypothetical protein
MDGSSGMAVHICQTTCSSISEDSHLQLFVWLRCYSVLTESSNRFLKLILNVLLSRDILRTRSSIKLVYSIVLRWCVGQNDSMSVIVDGSNTGHMREQEVGNTTVQGVTRFLARTVGKTSSELRNLSILSRQSVRWLAAGWSTGTHFPVEPGDFSPRLELMQFLV